MRPYSCCCSPAAVCSGFGVLMAASTTISASHTNDAAMWSQLIKEIVFVILGVPVFWIAVRLPPRGYRVLAYPMLIIAAVLLFAVLIPGIGVMAYGARRWIDFGPLQFQPSEFGKLAILVWGGGSARPQAAPRHVVPSRADRSAAGTGLRHLLRSRDARARSRHDDVLHSDLGRPAVDGRAAAAILRAAAAGRRRV